MQRLSLGDKKKQLHQTEQPSEESHPRRSLIRIERSIHLIPILTLFCFLILYLVSHDPHPPPPLRFHTDVMKSAEFGNNGGEVLEIGSHRNLLKKGNKSAPSHRKMGHF